MNTNREISNRSAKPRQNEPMLGMYIVVTGSLLGETGSWDDVVTLIKKHSLLNWLGLLCRVQELIIGDNITDPERIADSIRSLFGPRIGQKIEKLAREDPNSDKMLMVTSDILGILQQAAILYAPENSDCEFDSDEAREDTGRAVLIVAELLHGAANHNPSLADVVFEVARQSNRVGKLQDWKIIARSVYQFQIGEADHSELVAWFRNGFKVSTGLDLDEYFLGGLITYIRLAGRTIDQIRGPWTPVLPINGTQGETELIQAYAKVRSAPIVKLRQLIRDIEKSSAKNWTLIPIHKFPLVEMDEGYHFCLHPSAVAASLFDGIYYAILDHYRDSLKDKKRATAVQILGSKYGDLIEEYLESVLRLIFGDRLVKLAVSEIEGRKRCDFAVKYENKVILLEVKTSRFTAPKFYECRNSGDLHELIGSKVEIEDATLQLVHTIEDLRLGKINHPDFSGIDWTITTIIPTVVCEETLPYVPFTWQTFYSKFDQKLRPLSGGAGRVGFLRILAIEDLFDLIEVSQSVEVAQLLYRWGEQAETASNSLRNFLLNEGQKIESTYVVEGYQKAAKLVGTSLGFEYKPDPST